MTVRVGRRIGRLLPTPLCYPFLRLVRRFAPDLYNEALRKAADEVSEAEWLRGHLLRATEENARLHTLVQAHHDCGTVMKSKFLGLPCPACARYDVPGEGGGS